MEEEIAGRKQSEKALQESEVELKNINAKLQENYHKLEVSEVKFRTLVLTIPDIVYRIDQYGFLIFINDSIKRLGYEPKEVIGKHFSEIILPSDVEAIHRSVALPKYAGKITGDENAPKLFDERRTGKRKTRGLEIRLVAKNREALEAGLMVPVGNDAVAVEINSSGMWEINPDADVKEFIGTVGVIRDITHRKFLEKNLQEAYEDLEIKVEKRTAELAEVNKALLTEISERKSAQEELQNHRNHLEEMVNKRTGELQSIIKSMAGREVRMAELKKVIKKLRAQLEESGMKPVANDPIKEFGKDNT
jgi:PAS domain S-box-containing protein